MIPLLSPKTFVLYSPQEYHTYIKSLYREPPKPPPPADYTVWTNAKGTPVIRINRKPKFLTSAEVTAIAADLGRTLQDTWLLVLKKKIEIKLPEKAK